MTNEAKMLSGLKEKKHKTQKYCLRTTRLRVNIKCWLEVDVYASTFSCRTM